MATPKKDPTDFKDRGPKKKLPADARNRTIRCTDAEYARLMDYLQYDIRGRKRCENAVISSDSQKSGHSP